MDPATIAKSFKHSPSLHQQQPLFSRVMDQTHPLHYIKSFSSSHKKTSTLEDDLSFSSYLKPQDNDISIFDAHKYFGQDDAAARPRQNNNDSRLSSASSADGKNSVRTRSFHAMPTTASSDASWNSQTGLLVNSPASVKASPHNATTKKSSSSSSGGKSSSNKNWIFGRNKCCCTGKKSVRVKEATTSASVHHLGPISPPPTPNNNNNSNNNNNNSNKNKKKSTKTENKVAIPKSTSMSQRSSIPTPPPNSLVLPPRERSDPPPRQQRISASSGRSHAGGATGGFSFPILKNPAQAAAVRPPGGFKGRITKAIVSPLDEDTPRDSLEVYQPTDNIIPTPARHHHFHPSSPLSRVETTDDDLGSDASSDLFELDSFSTQTSLYPMYRRRDSLDEATTFNARKFNNDNNNNNNNIQYDGRSLDEPPTPSVAATECYAPSEVSIDWSVTTADRASVSNFSETGGTAFLRQRVKEEAGGDDGKRKGNNGGLSLMSCRHGKAVSVGPQPVKYSPAEGSGEAQHVGGRPPRASKTTTKLGNDRSAR